VRGASEAVKRAAQNLKDGNRSLILCNRKLTEEDMHVLAPAIKASSLRSLSLFDTQLSIGSIKMLCRALASHDSLTMLDLGHNRMGSEGVEAVCNTLIHNSSLLTLGLANVGMGDKGAALLADVVRLNRTLTEVYLNSNDIQEEGAKELAGALVFNDHSQISELYMFGNNMGEAGVAEMLKLLEDAPEAEENVPLDAEKALAFAMGTHSRLGAGCHIQLLAILDEYKEATRAPSAPKFRKPPPPIRLVRRIVRECRELRAVKRTIYGLKEPTPAPKTAGP